MYANESNFERIGFHASKTERDYACSSKCHTTSRVVGATSSSSSRRYKVKHEHRTSLTRMEYLSLFVCNEDGTLKSFEDICKVLPISYSLIYCSFFALLRANVCKDDINYVDIDEENNVLVVFNNKKIAQTVEDDIDGAKTTMGEQIYRTSVEVKGRNVHFSVRLTNPEVLNHTILPQDCIDRFNAVLASGDTD